MGEYFRQLVKFVLFIIAVSKGLVYKLIGLHLEQLEALDEPQKENRTEFFHIPIEVIDGFVLPHLGWNDLLRFRRVCRWTKPVVHGFIRLHPELTPELEINQDDKNFGDFLKMGIPTTRIFFNNAAGEEFFKTAGRNGRKFLKQYGPLVKHLRVDQYSSINNSKELTFLEALVNLETFEANMFGPKAVIDKCHDRNTNKSSTGTGTDELVKPIPKVFDHLKKVKMGNNKVFLIPNLVQFTGLILKTCLSVEEFALPFNEYYAPPPDFPTTFESYSMDWAFDLIRTSLEDEDRKLGTLKVIDFANYHSIKTPNRLLLLDTGAPSFLELCTACLNHNVKLFNVGADWFDDWGDSNTDPPAPNLGTVVYSLVNLHPCALQMAMPNLERIEITSSRHSNPGPHAARDDTRPDWPALKILDITIDSDTSAFHKFFPDRSIFAEMGSNNEIIFRCLFSGITRPALTELRLHFACGADRKVIPGSGDILNSCPNLKKLTLVAWPGTNKALSKLWSGLPSLEEISFENCRKLGNVAFVGEDADSPAFLKLTNLKRLSLKKLDKMPKITDTLFTLVLSHMKLTHLILTSAEPLKSLTLSGVSSLLDGKFADSIEKFSFQDWSLANVSSEKWAQLNSQFRSSSML